MPETVERLRTWLIADAHNSRAEISKFTLMNLLLVPIETLSLKLGQLHEVTRQATIDVGYPKRDIPTKNTKVSWLEHQLPIATQKARPVDSFYQPYDVQRERTEWGLEV